MVRPNRDGFKQNGPSPDDFRKLFVGGLAGTTTKETLERYYSKYGEVVDCVVMYDHLTKRSRGFGFVTFAEDSQVDDAMSSRPHSIDGRTVEPKRAIPRELSSEANISTSRLYIAGIREPITEKSLEDYFSTYGSVQNVEIIKDRNTGRPRGFGFVTFDDFDAVDKCVIVKYHQVDGVQCDVKKALSKEELSKNQQLDRDRSERERMRSMWGKDMGGRGGYIDDMLEPARAMGYGRDRYSPGRYDRPVGRSSRDPRGYERREVSPRYSTRYEGSSGYDNREFRGGYDMEMPRRAGPWSSPSRERSSYYEPVRGYGGVEDIRSPWEKAPMAAPAWRAEVGPERYNRAPPAQAWGGEARSRRVGY